MARLIFEPVDKFVTYFVLLIVASRDRMPLALDSYMHAMTLVVLFDRETRIVKEKECFMVVEKTPPSEIKGCNIKEVSIQKIIKTKMMVSLRVSLRSRYIILCIQAKETQ